MEISVTGTRDGMTEKAKNKLDRIIRKMKIRRVHHGDCVGVDKQFHDYIRDRDDTIEIIVHPPPKDLEPELQANCEGDVVLAPEKYEKRNYNVVDLCELLFAFPRSKQQVINGRISGTWQTINYAKLKNKPVIIIHPDGSCECYNLANKNKDNDEVGILFVSGVLLFVSYILYKNFQK